MGLVFAPLPNQGIAINQMSAGPRHAKGGGKGFGTSCPNKSFLPATMATVRSGCSLKSPSYRCRSGWPIAVASDKVDAPFHIFERNDPGRTKAVGGGRSLALVIPPGIQAAISGSVTGIVVPKVQAVAVKWCLGAFGCRLGIHQRNDHLIVAGNQQLFRGSILGRRATGSAGAWGWRVMCCHDSQTKARAVRLLPAPLWSFSYPYFYNSRCS